MYDFILGWFVFESIEGVGDLFFILFPNILHVFPSIEALDSIGDPTRTDLLFSIISRGVFEANTKLGHLS